MDKRARYAKPEYERRFLLDELPNGLVAPVRMRDRYLSDTRLRLRRIETMDGETIELKLGHKWRPDPDDPRVILHTSVYLDENEHRLISSLPGDDLVKVRHRVSGEPNWAIDRYESPNEGVVILEINFVDVEEAGAFDPPGFVSGDVTGEARYTGSGMARRTA